jgi:NTP pyrophosphatase (non-canonical NTP hydrolase)
MGKFKDEGNAALALAEECAEVIQVINKLYRFEGAHWDEIPEGKEKTRWEQLSEEMVDIMYQWERLKSLRYEKIS